jgi:hypothetical protein
MKRPVFRWTAHASDNLADGEIERDWVERTILEPDAAEPDTRHPERIRAYRVVPERGGRIRRVVYVRDGDICRIVSLFLDRGRRRRA